MDCGEMSFFTCMRKNKQHTRASFFSACLTPLPDAFLFVHVYPPPSAATFGYGNVLGMHAFGLAENGSFSLAEEKADMALTMESKDIWAVHAMAHVYEMEVSLHPYIPLSRHFEPYNIVAMRVQ